MTGAQITFRRTINASIDAMRGTVDDVMAFFNQGFGELDDASRYELKVVLNELIINAIRHGCKNDMRRRVSVVARLSRDGEASLAVEDDGDGYDAAALAKDIEAPRLEAIGDIAESGRGLAIVRNLCERFQVNAKGNKVVVVMRLSRRL